MTINEFLLARIEEDEKAATLCPDAVACAWSMRECAAKRAVVERYEFYVHEAGEQVGIAFAGARSAQEGLHDALCALAAAYDDHPGYQEEWAL